MALGDFVPSCLANDGLRRDAMRPHLLELAEAFDLRSDATGHVCEELTRAAAAEDVDLTGNVQCEAKLGLRPSLREAVAPSLVPQDLLPRAPASCFGHGQALVLFFGLERFFQQTLHLRAGGELRNPDASVGQLPADVGHAEPDLLELLVADGARVVRVVLAEQLFLSRVRHLQAQVLQDEVELVFVQLAIAVLVEHLEGVPGGEQRAGAEADWIAIVRIHREERHLELLQVDLTAAVRIAQAEVLERLRDGDLDAEPGQHGLELVEAQRAAAVRVELGEDLLGTPAREAVHIAHAGEKLFLIDLNNGVSCIMQQVIVVITVIIVSIVIVIVVVVIFILLIFRSGALGTG
eukprot:scaffold554_cov245-Pinguiococcus_pyrenoidosus.AAC.1